MIEPNQSEAPGSRFRGYRGKLVGVGVAVAAFLAWYEPTRNQAIVLICDIAKLSGQDKRFAICEPEEIKDPLKKIENLKTLEKEGSLSSEQSTLLARLERHFIAKTFEQLARQSGVGGVAADERARADTRKAVTETVKIGDPQERAALAKIEDGNIKGGLKLLSELASAATRESVKQWRRVGRIAYSVDIATALDAYERVVAMDISNPWDAVYLSRLYVQSGALDPARRTAERALDRLAPEEARDRMVLSGELGNILVAQGDLDAALTRYRASLVIAEDLARDDPGNAVWRRDLSVSHEKVGDVHRAQGDLDAALTRYRASLSIAEDLARDDPGNAGWRRDLLVSHIKVGEVHRAQGDLDAALTRYRAALAIAEDLARDDPGNAGWRRDLSGSHEKVGDVHLDQGDLDDALTRYRASLVIREDLARDDPGNAKWRRDLWVSHEKVGDVHLKRGDLDDALTRVPGGAGDRGGSCAG